MLGNVFYLHLFKLPETLAVKQTLDKVRFVKIIEEIPVSGGKEGEQYMQYKAQSLIDKNKIYTINNYLSPFNYTSIKDLESVLDSLKDIIIPEQMEQMLAVIEEIKEIQV